MKIPFKTKEAEQKFLADEKALIASGCDLETPCITCITCGTTVLGRELPCDCADDAVIQQDIRAGVIKRN
jgi:hypothetical protein